MAGLIVSSTVEGRFVPVASVIATNNDAAHPGGLATVPASFDYTLYALTGDHSGSATAVWDGHTAVPIEASNTAPGPPTPTTARVEPSSIVAASTPVSEPNGQTIVATNPTASSRGAASQVTNAPATVSATNTCSSSSNSLSAGAVGGIAAACIVGAAMVAGLLTWTIMRKRLNHYRNLAYGAAASGGHEGNGHPEKSMVSTVAPVNNGNSPDTSFLAGILPLASDDSDVKRRVNSILEAAAIHVDNFYDNVRLKPEENRRSAGSDHLLAIDGLASPELSASTKQMLAQNMLPKPVITRALTETITSAIDPSAPPAWSLLPAELTALPRSLQGTNRNTPTPALFWWRQLTAHLHSPANSLQSPPASHAERDRTAAELARRFQSAFRPWRKPKYSDAQETDALAGILATAADTGVWLFGQRSAFAFVWAGRGAPPGEIEVRPALVKVADANGVPLASPREVIPRALERAGRAL